MITLSVEIDGDFPVTFTISCGDKDFDGVQTYDYGSAIAYAMHATDIVTCGSGWEVIAEAIRLCCDYTALDCNNEDECVAMIDAARAYRNAVIRSRAKAREKVDHTLNA